MADLKLMARELEEKRVQLHNIYERTNTGKIDPVDGGSIYDMSPMDVEEVNLRTKELEQMEARYQAASLAEGREANLARLRELHEPNRRVPVSPVTGKGGAYGYPDASRTYMVGQNEGKTLSELFLESKSYQFRGNSPRKYTVELPDVDLKTLLATGTGYAPPNPRTNIVIPSAQRRPVIADLIPQDSTDLAAIKFMEETTFTNAANTTSEGVAKPESALAWTERTATMEKIATWIPVTEEQLDDIAQMRNLLDNRLSLMVLLKEETQLLLGNGVSAVTGFFVKTGLQTQAFSTNNADTIYNAFTKVRFTGFAEPSAVIMHPDQWQTIRLSKTSGSGEYIMGAPSVNGGGAVNVSGVETIWGKPVVVTPAMVSGSALVGDFPMYSHISRHLGLRVDISDSHSDYFVSNILAVRAEERLSLEIYRGAAFCRCNGLT